MTHYLKIWPQHYQAVADRSKTFEVRHNDRGFQKGDEVVLSEWCPDYQEYTKSKRLTFEIGYVLGINDGRVVFSLLPVEKEGEA